MFSFLSFSSRLSKNKSHMRIIVVLIRYVSLGGGERGRGEDEIRGGRDDSCRWCRRDRSVRRAEVGTKEAIHRWRGLLPNPHKAPHVATKSKFTFRAQT